VKKNLEIEEIKLVVFQNLQAEVTNFIDIYPFICTLIKLKNPDCNFFGLYRDISFSFSGRYKSIGDLARYMYLN
jgi:hypothetical protein